MINPAVLSVPAMVASQTVRRQQSSPCWESYTPTVDREARKTMVDYYVEELREAGFEVYTCQDVIDDKVLIKVRKGDIMYCTSIDNVYYADELCLTHRIRELVRKVENAFNEKEKK